jgi:hypothetical protein
MLQGDLRLRGSELEDYAKMVWNTVQMSIRHGPWQVDELYQDFTMAQLLGKLDANIQRGDKIMFNSGQDEQASFLRQPASEHEIEEAEKRLGRALPTDLKELLAVSNGCGK